MKKHVEVGQVYQSIGRNGTVWEVAKLVDQVGILHARLISMDNNRDQRLVACSVILESARYRLVRDVDSHGAEEMA